MDNGKRNFLSHLSVPSFRDVSPVLPWYCSRIMCTFVRNSEWENEQKARTIHPQPVPSPFDGVEKFVFGELKQLQM